MPKRKAKKTASKPVKVWLSRSDDYQEKYKLFTTKPKKDNHGKFQESGPRCRYLKGFCYRHFETYTGFTLAPGECCGVEINIRKV